MYEFCGVLYPGSPGPPSSYQIWHTEVWLQIKDKQSSKRRYEPFVNKKTMSAAKRQTGMPWRRRSCACPHSHSSFTFFLLHCIPSPSLPATCTYHHHVPTYHAFTTCFTTSSCRTPAHRLLGTCHLGSLTSSPTTLPPRPCRLPTGAKRGIQAGVPGLGGCYRSPGRHTGGVPFLADSDISLVGIVSRRLMPWIHLYTTRIAGSTIHATTFRALAVVALPCPGDGGVRPAGTSRTAANAVAALLQYMATTNATTCCRLPHYTSRYGARVLPPVLQDVIRRGEGYKLPTLPNFAANDVGASCLPDGTTCGRTCLRHRLPAFLAAYAMSGITYLQLGGHSYGALEHRGQLGSPTGSCRTYFWA